MPRKPSPSQTGGTCSRPGGTASKARAKSSFTARTWRGSTSVDRARHHQQRGKKRKGKWSGPPRNRDGLDLEHEAVLYRSGLVRRKLRRRGLDQGLTKEREPGDLERAVHAPDLVAPDGRVIRRVQVLGPTRALPVDRSPSSQRRQRRSPLTAVNHSPSC